MAMLSLHLNPALTLVFWVKHMKPCILIKMRDVAGQWPKIVDLWDQMSRDMGHCWFVTLGRFVLKLGFGVLTKICLVYGLWSGCVGVAVCLGLGLL